MERDRILDELIGLSESVRNEAPKVPAGYGGSAFIIQHLKGLGIGSASVGGIGPQLLVLRNFDLFGLELKQLIEIETKEELAAIHHVDSLTA